MKRKIGGTEHKDRQQRIATKQVKRQSQETTTTARAHQPPHDRLGVHCLPTPSGDMASAAPAKSKRSERDPIGTRGNTTTGSWLPAAANAAGRKVGDRPKHQRRKRKQVWKREANEERHNNPRSQLPAAQARIGEAENKRQRGGTVTAGLQRGRAKSDRNGSSSERSEDLRAKSDGGSLADNH